MWPLQGFDYLLLLIKTEYFLQIKLQKKINNFVNQQIKIILADMATGHWKILADKWQSQGLNGINGDSPKLRKSEELGVLI